MLDVKDKEFLREVGMVIRMMDVGYTMKEMEIRMGKTTEEIRELVECAKATKGN